MHSTFTISLVAAVAALYNPVAAGNWFQHCSSNSLDGSTLLSNCDNGHASINLNDYIGNSNGNLVWATRGNFGPSCPHCDLDYDILRCTCVRANGSQGTTDIDLEDHLCYSDNSIYYC